MAKNQQEPETKGHVYFTQIEGQTRYSVALLVDLHYEDFEGVCFVETGGHPHMIDGHIGEVTKDGFTFIDQRGQEERVWHFHQMTYENFSTRFYKYVYDGEALKERFHTTEELEQFYAENFPESEYG